MKRSHFLAAKETPGLPEGAPIWPRHESLPSAASYAKAALKNGAGEMGRLRAVWEIADEYAERCRA
jgi:hypothetical protein